MSTKRVTNETVDPKTEKKHKQSKVAQQKQKTGKNEQQKKKSDATDKDTRKQRRIERKAERKANKKPRRRIFPIWLRLIVVILLCAVALMIGLMVGYGVIGDGSPTDALKLDTWQYIIDFVTKD